MYTTFIRVSSVVNTHTAAGIGFMINGISEIFGEDTDAGHRRAFNSIKQLAVHLKAAVRSKGDFFGKSSLFLLLGTIFLWFWSTNLRSQSALSFAFLHWLDQLTQKDESHRVYNWQVVNALRLWTKVICTHATKVGSSRDCSLWGSSLAIKIDWHPISTLSDMWVLQYVIFFIHPPLTF